MRFPRECYQMRQAIEYHFPGLRPAQQRGLALWVFGTILGHSGCQNAVIAALLAIGRWHSLRQYLREWLYDGKYKASPCQTQLEIRLCFAPLLRWLLSWWTGNQLALAIDPTTHRDRLSAVVISVLYRGSAIPVAWHILPGNRPGPWIAPTLDLLSLLGPAIPKNMTVLVLTDRGLWSPRLWKQIQSLGWHPLMRVRSDAIFQPQGGCRMPARALVPGPGHGWVGTGTAFYSPKLRRRGVLVVVWGDDQVQPWILLTDLPPESIGVCWYGLRVWIELGFRALKGVGWQWEHTRRTDPVRAGRHWLGLAVAMAWVMAYGTRVEDASVRGMPPAPPIQMIRPWPRQASVFQQGHSTLLRQLLKGRPWQFLWLAPELWPVPPPTLRIINHNGRQEVPL